MFLSRDDIPQFIKWLDDQGAQVLATTNPYELVRFKTVNGVSVVYTGKKGQSFTGESEVAYQHWRDKKRWITHDRYRRQMTSLKKKLANRDGEHCFWCGKVDTIDNLTVEHILNKMHGGSDNTRNLSLACPPCQRALGNSPIVEKILYRERMLGLNIKSPVVKKHLLINLFRRSS